MFNLTRITKNIIGMSLFLGWYALALAGSQYDRLAKVIIATHLNVSLDSFGRDTPISKIGKDVDHSDAIKILEITEKTFRGKITDTQVEHYIGKFDRQLAQKFTASKLAKIIQQLHSSVKSLDTGKP